MSKKRSSESDTELTVAILAGGDSKRFRSEKALATFHGRPLLTHMMDVAKMLSQNTLVVTSDDSQQELLQDLAVDARLVTDPDDAPKAAITGALTAFEFTETKYTLLLPVDTPLAKHSLLQVLYELCPGHGAVVPTWPSGHIEPLHSVYHAEHAYERGLKVVEDGQMKMRHLIDSMTNVLGVSTTVLSNFDPQLDSFCNINTEKELRDLEKKTQR
ncbi:MAG: molybdenum cofactor guanylyltransferase [Candidatus Thorarchaeota archaeon]|nr:MAG: molybdenum cofactor guanylyltransferase [Candidatus Thorarchaeota archaeon]